MSKTLVQQLDREAVALTRWLKDHEAAKKIWDGTVDLGGYVRFLIQTYHYVRWTQPLLARAGQQLQRQGGSAFLAELFAAKAREESGHERWALSDLRALGQDTSAVQAQEPSDAVSAYVSWNRLMVESASPAAFLGTAYVLESISVRCGKEVVRNLRRRSAIPGIAGAISFLRGHAGADVGHLAQLGSLLGHVPDTRDREAILLSARVTRRLYEGLFAGPYRRRQAC